MTTHTVPELVTVAVATKPTPISNAVEAKTDSALDVCRELGDLPAGALVTEAGLAKMLHKHPESIRRAVERGELPRPARLMGKPTWTVGAIVRHIEARLNAEAKEADRFKRKVSSLSA